MAEISDGARLRAARRTAKKTQSALARKAGLSRETINRIENGHGREPHRAHREAIAAALGCSVDAIFKKGGPALALPPSKMRALRARRHERNLTLEQCAAALGISSATLSRRENGSERKFKSKAGKPAAAARWWYAAAYMGLLGFEKVSDLESYLRRWDGGKQGKLSPFDAERRSIGQQ